MGSAPERVWLLVKCEGMAWGARLLGTVGLMQQPAWWI